MSCDVLINRSKKLLKMENQTIRISKDQLSKLDYKAVDEKKYPNRDLSAILRMLKVATNKTMNSKKLTTVIFQSKKRGIFTVKSSILMAGNEFVVFKGGFTLPIKSIIQIKQ